MVGSLSANTSQLPAWWLHRRPLSFAAAITHVVEDTAHEQSSSFEKSSLARCVRYSTQTTSSTTESESMRRLASVSESRKA